MTENSFGLFGLQGEAISMSVDFLVGITFENENGSPSLKRQDFLKQQTNIATTAINDTAENPIMVIGRTVPSS